MNNSIELLNLAKTVNIGLTNYINVHNLIFKESATFKSLIKNIFGKGISGEQLLNYSENLSPEWNEIFEELEKYKRDEYLNLNEIEKTFFNTLLSYSKSLRETINLLIKRQIFLYQKSINNYNDITSYGNYDELHKEYELSIIRYRKIGEKLNSDYRKLL
jgi:hypothetical protein